jgi:hypothetical protein
LAKLDERRTEEVLSQLEIRRTLLDENREQQAGLVETLTMLKQENAKARVVAQLDTLAVEDKRIQASIAQLEQQDSVLSAARKVLSKFAEMRSRTDLATLSTAERRRLLFDFGTRVVVFPSTNNRWITAAERCQPEFDVMSRAYSIDCTINAMPWPPPMHSEAAP